MTHSTSTLALKSRVDAGPEQYRFHTDPSVTAPDSFRTAELLLCEAIWESDPGRLRCLQANYGVTGVVLAAVADAVTLTESSARATRLCERNAAVNDVDVAIELATDLTVLDGRPATSGTVDAVAYAPEGYTPISVGKQRIVDAMATLAPGRSIYVAASSQSGLVRYEACLEDTAGDASRVASRDGCHVLRAERPADFDPPQFVTPHTLRPTIDDVNLALSAVPGLFAANHVDNGTRLLAETVEISDGECILDCCCGYGALGAYAGSVADCDLWLTDDDRVATACAERSLDASNVTGTVVTADGVDGVRGKTFNLVLCNPPTHAPDRVLSDLLAGVRELLAADGRLVLVHHQSLDMSDHLSPFDGRHVERTGEDHMVVSARA